ncbi:MAG TPA: hypothetical protein VGL72_26240 [Bryobacteraceae bacterium]|jgi:hypothetical protein
MDENTFAVVRLANEPGNFIVTPWPSFDPPSGPVPGLVSREQTFRGSEEETRQFLAGEGQSSFQIKTLIDRAQDSPEISVPECIVTATFRPS